MTNQSLSIKSGDWRVDNLIPWYGGKLVDGDQEILMVPLMAGDGTSTRSQIHKPFKITRKCLSGQYISQPGNVDSIETRVYSKPEGGLWYVAGDDEDGLSLRYWIGDDGL